MKRPRLLQAGFTLVELILAMGLFSLLLVGLLELLDTTTNLWRDVEHKRERTEVGSALIARLERDLSTLESGIEGDFWADWTTVDVNGDELSGMNVPRLRFVRRASARELARLTAASPELSQSAAKPGAELEDDLQDPSLVGWQRIDRGLCEVVWALVPLDAANRDVKHFEGHLIRGVRLLSDSSKMSLLDPRVFAASGRPVPGLFEELSSDVLWMEFEFASQMTQTRADKRWSVGLQLGDGARAWDAWDRGRLDLEKSGFNVEPQALPAVDELPNLPRRVRVRFEIESSEDRLRRPQLLNTIDHDTIVFDVSDGTRLPAPGRHVLVDEEWMEVRSVSGDRVTVLRGQRGTLTVPHGNGTPLFHGWVVETEIPIGVSREDWDL